MVFTHFCLAAELYTYLYCPTKKENIPGTELIAFSAIMTNLVPSKFAKREEFCSTPGLESIRLNLHYHPKSSIQLPYLPTTVQLIMQQKELCIICLHTCITSYVNAAFLLIKLYRQESRGNNKQQYRTVHVNVKNERTHTYLASLFSPTILP